MRPFLERLRDRLAEKVLSTYSTEQGDDFALVNPAALRAIAQFCKEDPELDLRMFVSMCVVDRLLLPEAEPRFELVYQLRQGREPWKKLHLKVRLPEGKPEVDSVQPIWKGADWWERYAWDFYGIRFTGHPDLRRILMYEELEGHPLRKDYPLRGRQPLVEQRGFEDLIRGPGAAPPRK
ncbi:MAG: NADH-quinone oxidoreductase subunit C [Myxococcales bacterium]|jgi:NADH-quinone oxidoreductase subunit C